MENPSINSVLVCGSGLAFEMTLAALGRNLPNSIRITGLELENIENRDSFYGYITTPNAYNFLLSLGLDEPNLILKSQTNFTYGTAYENWAGQFNWAQCFHQPFPVWDNIQFHHFPARMGAPLPAFLVNSMAGLNGRFVHPPIDPKNPLSQAEYGYVFDPKDITRILRANSNNTLRTKGTLKTIYSSDERFTALELFGAEKLEADFIIDCCGPNSPLIEDLGMPHLAERTLAVREIQAPASQGFSLKHIKANPQGWESVVRLQNKNLHLAVGHPESMPDSHYTIQIAHSQKPWRNNYLAVGHAANVEEPFTPAPMMLLQRDIERLLNLFPVSSDMSVEAREYNRLFTNDRMHCHMFFRSFFEIAMPPNSPYWEEIRAKAAPNKLLRKIEQFESRGYVTMYDLEPFNAEDWIIQHFGLGRHPDRYDVYLDQLSETHIRQRLGQLSANINTVVQKMPPTDRYMKNFRRYLEKKHGS